MNKPRLLSFRNDFKTNAQQIKNATIDYMIPFNQLVTEYLDFIRHEEPITSKRKDLGILRISLDKKKYFNIGSRSGQIEEEDYFVEVEYGEDTINSEFSSLSQFEIQERGGIMYKRSIPLE